MGIQLFFSYIWEVLICTPSHSGLLANVGQNFDSDEDHIGPIRGQAQGDAPKNKVNLKQKTKKFSAHKNNLNTLYSPAWVGGFIALSLGVSLFLGAPKAHAADLVVPNTELAKKVVESATPLINPAIAKNASVGDNGSDSFIEKPIVAETKVTVDQPRSIYSARTVAQVPTQSASAAKPQVLAEKTSQKGLTPVSAGPHYFPYGQCTYYVAQKRLVPWGGNAGTWLSGAKSYGYATGKTAKAGAIMVSSEGGRVGHVAYVESVNDGEMTISEMNYRGFGIVSKRTIPAASGFIKGFIY